MSFFLKTFHLVAQKPIYPIVMQCKSLHYTTITDVSTPYNRKGINLASIYNTNTVKTTSYYFYQPVIITLKILTKKPA